ncbi:hypothetical protein [Methylobacterium bullatum]|uniref:Uncharacterized protein n=1 Tax=Methylobacterium bullatum TaxID=570505 RepID=A0AAV4ZEQ3_9HYPH|nr:hypothetical protein [Methylobacterium bullatum]GJD41965.1 hypothetical protein OICFNHDK_4456 [Methylobacterium bullatum]
MFLVLAHFDVIGRDEIARRLRHVIDRTDIRGVSDLSVIARSVVLLRRPRDLVRAMFGAVPDGLLGALKRFGDDPLSKSDSYHALYRLFSSADPQDRLRAKVLGQIAGGLVGAQIEVVQRLDPVLLHPAFVAKVYEVKQVDDLNHALAYVRERCSRATDDAIRESLSRLGPDGHRSTVFRRWAQKFDVLPRPLDTRGDSTLRMLDTGKALVDAGRRYTNCLAKKVEDVFLGRYLYVEYQPPLPEPGLIGELRVTTRGYVLEGLYAAKNRRVAPERARAVRAKLAACGVALYDHAPGDRKRVLGAAKVLDVYNFEEPDNTGWGAEFDDIAPEAVTELERAFHEAA